MHRKQHQSSQTFKADCQPQSNDNLHNNTVIYQNFGNKLYFILSIKQHFTSLGHKMSFMSRSNTYINTHSLQNLHHLQITMTQYQMFFSCLCRTSYQSNSSC